MVILANIRVAVASNIINVGIVFTIFASIFVFVTFQLIIVLMWPNVEQYATVKNLAEFPSMYFAILFFFTIFVIIDSAIDNLRKYLKIRRLAKVE